jgi:hypothetical protein
MMAAQVETLEKIKKSFGEYTQSQGDTALVVAVILASLVVALLLYSFLPSRAQFLRWRLFHEFSEASGLSAPESKLLMRVAERVQPDDPAALFVKRSLFEAAVADLGLDPSLAAPLRRKVYGP